MTQNDETRDRFLAAIAERLTPDSIAEAHVFPPIRQGGVESGVAVIAVNHGAVPSREAAAGHGSPTRGEAAAEDGSPTSGEAAAENARRAFIDSARAPAEDAVEAPAEDAVEAPAEDAVEAPAENDPARLTVYTAKYRLIVKGPERGKWEFALEAEADAPRLTIDKVVRGVQQRSGDAEDPTRISGQEFLDIISARGAPEARP